MLPGAMPVALCGVLRYDLRRSVTASLIGVLLSMAILTVFPKGFMKHPASLACGW